MSFRRHLALLVTLSLGVLFASTAARADVFDPKQVPADAKWMIHIDVDALRNSPAWEILNAKIKQSPANDQIGQIELLSGMRFPEDLHDATAYGLTFTPTDAVVLVHAKVERLQIEQLLAQAPGYDSEKYNDHDLDTWTDDKGEQLYGAFVNDTLIAIGHDKDSIKKALDVLDGKGNPAKTGDAVAPAVKPGVAIVVACTDLANLKGKAQSPVFTFLQSGWITLTPGEKAIAVDAQSIAKTPQDAEKSKQALVGIKAFVDLAAAKDNPDHKAKIASKALNDLNVTVQDKTIIGQMNVPYDVLRELLEVKPEPQPAPQK